MGLKEGLAQSLSPHIRIGQELHYLTVQRHHPFVRFPCVWSIVLSGLARNLATLKACVFEGFPLGWQSSGLFELADDLPVYLVGVDVVEASMA